MVRKLRFGKHPAGPDPTPPPPYQEGDSHPPLIFSEVRTTTEVVTTTTTQTTTHILSLPLWRKRAQTMPPPGDFPFAYLSSAHYPPFSGLERSIPRVEKDLPPTPSSELSPAQQPGTPASAVDSAEEIAQESALPSLFPPSNPSLSSENAVPGPSSSTAALAHAALGIGLPHVIPYVSTPRRSSELNTVAFNTPTSPAHNLRKSKSSSRLRVLSSDKPPSPERDAAERSSRTRGISLVSDTSAGIGSPSSSKGKEKDTGSTVEAPAKDLSRRGSFWRRKKSISAEKPSTSDVASLGLTALDTIPPLPSPPSSSATPALTITMEPNPGHARGLSRSHSERTRSSRNDQHRSQGSPGSLYAERPERRRSGRPATADALQRTPHPLFIDPSSQVTSSPVSAPTLEVSRSVTETNVPSRRPRAATNPPFLHRLSLGWFAGSSSNSQAGTPFPQVASPRASRDDFFVQPAPEKRSVTVPPPLPQQESPEFYVHRLLDAVSKTEITGILASSTDPFHAAALRAYIDRFDFTNVALDVALRRLLMDVSLPKETQQIDRVMEAFAKRYESCNPGLFTSEDHPYILAFSIIMLHTDAFNKSNKQKMTKNDYIKNTRLPGVPPEVLDCFYDNIVLSPFIFVEDSVDINGQRGFVPETPVQPGPVAMAPSISTGGMGPGLLNRGNRIDPYFLITNNLLDPLRVDVESYVPSRNPYSYQGTAGSWNEEELRSSFTNANAIALGPADQSRHTSTLFSLGVGVPTPMMAGMGGATELQRNSTEVSILKVSRLGVLHRKDDLLDGGRRATNRKWRTWSVLLTGSQLLFFRDVTWAGTLLSYSADGQILYPQTSSLRPDEVLSVHDAIAVYDASDTKHQYTFRFASADGRQFLLAATDEQQMNEWLARINYASTFKSVGVRLRPPGMSGEDVHLTGVAAATSHLHDLEHHGNANSNKIRHWNNGTPGPHLGARVSESEPTFTESDSKAALAEGLHELDLDGAAAPEVDGADQFKATFDQVKADLAAGRFGYPDDKYSQPESRISTSDSDPSSSSSLPPQRWCLPSRTQVIRNKIAGLDEKVSATQSQLESHLRFARNIAILTPFQKTTRDRLLLAIQGIGKRVMQTRLDLSRLECHRYVLSSDLAAEARDWGRAKQMALKAATEKLESRRAVPFLQKSQSRSSDEAGLSASPDSRISHRPESTCESFHSALDFGPEWPSFEISSTSDPVDTSHIFDSPNQSGWSSSLQEYPFTENKSDAKLGIQSATHSPLSSDEGRVQENFSSPEEAELWHRTRCANGRVSLVRMPSSLTTTGRLDSLLTGENVASR